MAEQPKSQRGANLSQQDRERGGRTSAAKQVRDARGQFAGSRGSSSGKAARKSSPPNGAVNQNKKDQDETEQDEETTGMNANGRVDEGYERGEPDRQNRH